MFSDIGSSIIRVRVDMWSRGKSSFSSRHCGFLHFEHALKGRRASSLFWYKQIWSRSIWLQEQDVEQERRLKSKGTFIAMTLQGRFYFLNLWDEDEGEFRDCGDGKGSVEEQDLVCAGPSQWVNGQPGDDPLSVSSILAFVFFLFSPLSYFNLPLGV